MPVQIHLQLPLSAHGSHGEMNPWKTGNNFFVTSKWPHFQKAHLISGPHMASMVEMQNVYYIIAKMLPSAQEEIRYFKITWKSHTSQISDPDHCSLKSIPIKGQKVQI